MSHFTHFMPGTMVYVTYDTTKPNTLRAEPRLSAQKLDLLPPKSVVEILGGPVHADNHTFWQVRMPLTRTIGWTSQGSGAEIYLRAVSERIVCSALPGSLLQPGDRAMVARHPPTSNRVRADHSLTSAVVGNVPPGEMVIIEDGPACDDPTLARAHIWWKIRAAAGLTGWTAEGEGEERWLVPVEVGHRYVGIEE